MAEPSDDLDPVERESNNLVVIGASAGGVDALLRLFHALPADFPAPIVVAQHLDPRRPSLLSELIAARSALPVVLVADRETLTPGTIYVIPSAFDVEISDQHVRALREASGPSTPSVDRLMASAARVFGDQLIGVILTGIGADGALGAQAIKAYGGTVIVQNPTTAQFAGMPSSVPSASVDVVADLEAIGPLLVDMVNGRYGLPPSGQDGELRLFLDRVRDLSGIDFGAYKRPTIERRLQRRMAAVGVTGVAEYQRYLERHPDELQRLVAAFLIKVTRFFRDPDLFDYLRAHVLPKLIARARERGELRLWSAGCSTGEEAYTLAMVVADLVGEELNDLPARIFATDVASEAIDFARRAVYPDSAIADVPPELVDRFFQRVDGAHEVRKAIRGLVVFGEHDLGIRAPFPRIDLVLCRNVLIYFTPELQRAALQRFAFSLYPGGYLVLGKAESASPLPAFFALEQPRLKVFRRNEAVAPVVTERDVGATLAGTVATRPNRHPATRRLAPSALSPLAGPRLAEQAVGLLDALAIGVVVVDRSYDVRAINVAAMRLLGVHGAGIGEDLIHLVPAPLAGPLRGAIDAALSGKPASFTHRLAFDVVVDRERDLAVMCSPVQGEPSVGHVDAVRVEVAEITEFVRARDELSRERDELRAELATLRERMATAVSEVRELRVANESMALEVGRLRAENEQFQLAHEEVQAAAEEIETLNEEQQATNEELETLNEELQATVEELNAANAEQESRATEFEATASTLEQRQLHVETERERLDAMLDALGVAVLAVDADRRAVRVNRMWREWFGPSGDLEAVDDAGRALPDEAQPIARAARGERVRARFVVRFADGSHRPVGITAVPVGSAGALRFAVVTAGEPAGDPA